MRIKNITLGIPQKICSHLSIRPMIDDLDATSCNTFVQVFDKQTINGQIVKSVEWTGNVPINEQQYALCKNNPTLMENYVLLALGLERRV